MTGPATILVAHDEASLRTLARATLGSAYRVLEARDGAEALIVARAEHPDLVLLDANLPGLDASSVCRQLKADPQTRAVVVLMLSAMAPPEDGQRDGADGYLTKPLNPVGLLAAVERLLTRDTDREEPTPTQAAVGNDQSAVPDELAQTLRYARELGTLFGRWKAQIAAIQHQSLHDELTDLPNRTLLRDRLRQTILAGRADAGPLALLLMDLDHFKEINDTLGHRSGDLVLREVGSRLTSSAQQSDTVSRMGGDEFAVLLPVADAAKATFAAEQILGALREPFVLEGLPIELEASIGIALYPEHGEDADALIRRADVAMYVAKAAKSGYALYVGAHDQYSPGRLALAAELRHGIESGELLLHYQPRVDCGTGGVDAVEALARWQHPQHGLMRPDQFVPLAERTGLMKGLTLWVLEAAFRQCRAWRQAGIDLGVGVNLSPRDFHDPQLPERIARLLVAGELEPAWVELEITESAVMADDARVKKNLSCLRDIGVRFALDDFGTGYSSLAHLKELPVHTIKIDKSFVSGMAVNAKDAAIVRSAIALGHNLGLHVVAEGVEDRATWNLLIALGCDGAQGNYLAPPSPPEQLAPALMRDIARAPQKTRKSSEPS